MKITVEKLGVIRYAELETGDITIVCGQNNTGKTYITYAYYGFLDFIKDELPNYVDSIMLPSDFPMSEFEENGMQKIDISKHVKNYQHILKKICDVYSSNIQNVFVSNKERFKDTKFSVSINEEDLGHLDETIIKVEKLFQIHIDPKDNSLLIAKPAEGSDRVLPSFLIRKIVEHAVIQYIFQNIIPKNTFIASVERTGTSIFKKELYLNRNRLLEKLSDSTHNKDVDIRELLSETYSPYPLPVKHNVAFIQELEQGKDISEFGKQHPEILEEFTAIVGGTYSQDKEGELFFTPNTHKTKKVKLQFPESSSVVRALVHIDYYLRYYAKKGDLLIVDEPELNLHPENQRKLARIFARLVNSGVKVFITTHSDYITKELSLLLLLNKNTPQTNNVLKKYPEYKKEMALDLNKVRAYIAKNEKININGKTLKSSVPTLVPAVVNESGIELPSFDETINSMNEIQDELLWG